MTIRKGSFMIQVIKTCLPYTKHMLFLMPNFIKFFQVANYHFTTNRYGQSANVLAIRVGEHDWHSREPTEQYRSVLAKYQHLGYRRYNSDNDITLLKLSSPLVINEYVKPVCIPQEQVPVGTECLISGWGSTCNFSWCFLLKSF